MWYESLQKLNRVLLLEYFAGKLINVPKKLKYKVVLRRSLYLVK
jgi:hypothetical protein